MPDRVCFVLLLVLISVKTSTSLCEKVKKEVTCSSVTDISSRIISAVPDISKATSLCIKFNPQLQIQSKSFESAVQLERVVISNNKIAKIYSHTFKNLPVKYLNLAYNGINNIYIEAFHNLSLLETLRLENNNLQDISVGLFDNLPLKDLTMSHNSIRTLENDALRNLPNLKKLRLDNNQLQVLFIHRILTYPEQLELLWLHNNSLTTITNYMLQRLSNLTILNVGNNLISSIEENAFEHTPKLNLLVLSYNHLKEVDGKIFPRSGLDHLTRLYLDNNKLMFLSSSFFVRLGNVRKMTIVGNPWLCPCLTEVQKIMAENNIREMCNEEYTNGSRAVCVNERDAVALCYHVYNNALSQRYEDYKESNPVYRSALSCLF